MHGTVYTEERMNQKLEPHYGAGVDGAKFWPRPKLTKKTLRTLRSGGSIALFGPRRTGKSSVMKETKRLLSEDNKFHVIELNLEGRVSMTAFVTRLLKQLPEQTGKSLLQRWTQLPFLPEALTEAIKRFSDGKAGGDKADDSLFMEFWAQLAEAVEKQVLESDKTIVFFFDELPYFCDNQIEAGVTPDTIDTFLATLRRWRQAGIPMAIAGSIGIREIARQHELEMDHLNDLVSVTIPPLEDDDAKDMLRALAAGFELDWWSDELADAVIATTADTFPSFLQRAMIEIESEDARTPEAVAVALKGTYRREFEISFFEQFSKRLKHYGDEEPTARKILSTLAARNPCDVGALAEAAKETGMDDDAIQNLLIALEQDAFIATDPETREAVFAYKVVETWWRSRP